ncbi:unnamed protein product [Rotaria sp. Silwood2]|nr:unnamed protein product [Rotaria sp. Silwood2]CAF2602751.1 unnamed protein product [Rotaria sp. Silwood2]CAF2828682.1 unnamed protein product [Rotaria sp. Silwood2]CAF2973172.1 unnamed protein product [Rotaria sp. Silwood2]CAF3856364.1 unnamed protein product [Rotaria sp. Silwood2]
MTTHTIMSFDSHHTIYNNRTYVQTTYSSTTNQSFHSYLTALPIPSINICENLLYGAKMADDVGSASSSSYIHSHENYDNQYAHTYDNPIECLENYNIKQNLINLSHDNENLYDNTQNEAIDDNENHYSSNTSHSTSPILFYLENKSLALYTCIISLLLLLIIAFGIFLLNKFIRPFVVNTTVNNHYDIMNISNTSTTPITSRSTISSTLLMLLTQPSTDMSTSATATTNDGLSFSNTLCPSDRWGIGCKNVCKPCGLGICHSITGKCICPADIYGEFCDLWKVEDKPKRGDMMS